MSQPVCAIVGMGPGMGMALARRFAREGFTLALMARRSGAVQAFRDSLRKDEYDAHSYVMDAADSNRVRQTFEQIQAEQGPVSLLIYNAAVLNETDLNTVTPESLLADYRVNVVGALHCAQQVIPAMRENGGGKILFTGGGLALHPNPKYASLAMGKAALRNLTFSLGKLLKRDKIHVATVTVAGYIKADTHFAPENIAETFWTVYNQEGRDREYEVIYD